MGLIKRFAEIYIENKLSNSKIILSTNREISEYITHDKVSLKEFLSTLEMALKAKKSIKDIDAYFIQNNTKDLNDKWSELKNELLGVLKTEKNTLEFLYGFELKEEVGLSELTETLLNKISKIFSVDIKVSENILSRLDNKLREWVTTCRKKEEITREDVLSAISKLDLEIGNHFIEPPANFFESRTETIEKIQEALNEDEIKVVFLTGQAGIGKTTIISKLKYEDNISFRYYAYKPITPNEPFVPSDYDELVKERTLWNDLLIQIKRKFREKSLIAKYNVPVINGILLTVKLREEVLRLAKILSEIEGKEIIIVIDGIDHAARAGIENGFINKLIPPDQIPKGVKFIISGQLAENYTDYPNWLKNKNSKVKKIEVKSLTPNDISILSICLPQNFDNDVLNKIIFNYTAGNTLSVIFAIEEAKLISSIQELEQKLRERELASGLDSYYQNIWNYALLGYSNKENLSNILSIVFSMTEDKVSPEFLTIVFSKYKVGLWEEILSKLKPIVDYNDGYYLRVNDIRVFLSSNFIKDTTDYYKILNDLVNFYIKTKEKYITKQKYLLIFMKILKRELEFPNFLNTKYLVDSYEMNLPLDNSLSLLNESLYISIKDRDYKKILNLQEFSTALSLLNNYNEYYDIDNQILNFDNNFFKSEIIEKNIEFKSIEILAQDINLLIKQNELNRAKLIFDKWFKNNEITSLLELTETVLQNDNYNQSDENKISILNALGKLFFELDISLKLENSDKYQSSLIKLYSSYLERCESLIYNTSLFQEKLSKVPYGNVESYLKLLRKAFNSSNYETCKIIIKIFVDKEFKSPSSTLTFMSIILNYEKEYFLKTISEHFIESKDYMYASEMEIGFISGYINKELTIKNLHPEKSESILIEGFKILGRSYKDSFENLTVSDIVMPLNLCIYNGISSSIFKGDKLYLKLIICIFNNFHNNLQSFIIKEFRTSLTQEKSLPRNFSIISKFLIEIGKVSEIKEKYKRLFSKDSFLWDLELTKRNETINYFFESTNMIFSKKEIEYGKNKIKHFPIGYTEDKEYSLYFLLEIYNILCKKQKNNWKNYGIQLLSINEIDMLVLSMEELFDKFENGEYGYNYGLELIKRLGEKISYQKDYEEILEILLKKEFLYGFYNSGYKGVFEKLFFKLSDVEKKWLLVEKIFENDEKYIYELNRRVEFVNKCFLYEQDINSIEEHFIKISNLHKLIVDNRLLKPLNFSIDFDKKEVKNKEFEVDLSTILLENFQSNSIDRIQITLKGLYKLFLKNSDVFYTILKYYENTSFFNKIYFHFLFMKIVKKHGEKVSRYINQIKLIYNETDSIYEKMGLYLVLSNYQLFFNEFEFELEYIKPKFELSTPLLFNKKVHLLQDSQIDRMISGDEILLSRLKFLKVMTKDEELIHEIMQYVLSNKTDCARKLDISYERSGVKRIFSEIDYSLDQVIYKFVYENKINLDFFQLIQSIYYLTNETILFNDSKFIKRKLFSDNMFEFQKEEWEKLMRINVKEDEVVLSSSIIGFYKKKIQEVIYNSYLNTIFAEESVPYIFNAPEIFLDKTIQNYDEKNWGDYLFAKNVGMSLFQNDSISLFPTQILTKELGFFLLYQEDQITLKNPEGDEIKLEILTGEDGKNSYDELTNAFLQRWVCKKELLIKLKENLDIKFDMNINLTPIK